MNNPVAKHANTYCKPKTFRNRKKEQKLGHGEPRHPKHMPYEREKLYINELLGDWNAY